MLSQNLLVLVGNELKLVTALLGLVSLVGGVGGVLVVVRAILVVFGNYGPWRVVNFIAVTVTVL
jgi:hypothetical protein